MTKKTFFKWSWIFFVSFFILSVIHIQFALVGLICMLSPILLSSLGHGRKNCSSICPRGSFLQQIIDKISLNYPMPKFMTKKWFKHLILILLFLAFSYSMYMSKGNINKIAFAIFRMVAVTTVIAFILGVIYKPRTWCAVCPMGHLSGEITKYKAKNKSLKRGEQYEK